MKRFLLFAGYVYYPAGGWDDFKGSYDDLDEAKEALKNDSGDWGQIIDTATGEEVNG